jgi:GH35 family endo-1,4-beta-xylanase
MNTVCTLLLLPLAVYAADTLPPGQPVLSSDPIAAAQINGAPQWGNVERVAATNEQSASLRVRTVERPPSRYTFQVRFTTETAVARGNILLLSFAARAVEPYPETGEAELGISVQESVAPWASTFNSILHVGKEWQEFDLPFRSDLNLATGGGQVCLQQGVDPQLIELRQISLTNFGSQVELRDLPTTRFTYAGRELDAAWRAAAQQRIEQHRKGELHVMVQDATGRPVRDALVTVTMKRHAFGWGSAVTAQMLTDDTPDARKYRETVRSMYNRVVFENDLKWPQWDRVEKRDTTLQAIDWLRQQDIAIRGHCLVWPSWKYMPRDVESLKDDLPAMKDHVARHVTDEASALRGKLVEFDVINEPYSNHDLMDLLGERVMVDWFQLAQKADPSLKLYINDYAILSAGGRDAAHQQHYEKTIRYLLDQGAPLHGIGLQSHFGMDLTSPARLLTVLDRFAAFEVPLQVTEHDIDITDEELQADYTRDFLTVMFSHPAVDGVLTWGFWEGRHWKPNGAYFRRDWSVKPAGRVWRDLVLKQWWTRAEGRTDSSGQYRVRGFLGDYAIIVKKNGKTSEVESQMLSTDGLRVSITLAD